MAGYMAPLGMPSHIPLTLPLRSDYAPGAVFSLGHGMLAICWPGSPCSIVGPRLRTHPPVMALGRPTPRRGERVPTSFPVRPHDAGTQPLVPRENRQWSTRAWGCCHLELGPRFLPANGTSLSGKPRGKIDCIKDLKPS